MKWKSLLLVLVVCFLRGAVAWSLSLSDLLTQSRVYLRDTNTTRPRFSDSQLTFFFNNGQREIAARSWCLIASSAITLQSGTTEYSLPSDCIAPLRVTVNHNALAERPFSFLDEAGRAWINEPGGTPREYYVRTDSSVVANVSRESIGFHPVSTFTASAIIQYAQQPSDLVSASDIPFSGNNRLYPYHQSLAFYAAFSGYMALGMKEEAMLYFQLYTASAGDLDGNNSSRTLFNPNFRGVKPAPAKEP